MKKVVVILGAPIPVSEGKVANAIEHQRVTDVQIKDGWLVVTMDNGTSVGYNLNLVITYSIDPHGSVLH